MREKDQIFILKTTRTSESHLIVYGLNPRGARMNFWAPSALKSQKRFGGGVLNPPHLVSILYKKSRNLRGLDVLEEGWLIQSFPGLQANYKRMELALYFLSLILKVCQKGVVDNSSLFQLLKKALRASEHYLPLEKLKFYFEAKLLEQQGVLPPYINMERIKNKMSEKGKRERGEKSSFLHLKNEVEKTLFSYLSRS